MKYGEYLAARDFDPAGNGDGWCVRVLICPDPEVDGYDSEVIAEVFEHAETGGAGAAQRRARLFAGAPELEDACVQALAQLRACGVRCFSKHLGTDVDNAPAIMQLTAALKKAGRAGF